MIHEYVICLLIVISYISHKKWIKVISLNVRHDIFCKK